MTGFPGVVVGPGGPVSVSSNGELVAFSGGEKGLVAGADASFHPYVRDRQTNQTLIIDAAPATGADDASPGVLPLVQAGDSTEIALSSNGGIIAFSSDASNLAPGVLNGASNVYLKNTNTGQTTLVSNLPAGFSGQPTLSANGQVVAFTNDVDGPVLLPAQFGETFLTTETIGNVYVENVSTGALSLVSVETRGHRTWKRQFAGSGVERQR